MRFFDSHCHLQAAEFRGETLGRVLKRAADAGVEGMLCCGTCCDDWEALRQVARGNEEVVPFFGVHPWYMDNIPDDWQDRLEEFLGGAAGIGEIGLDHAVKQRQDVLQEKIFVAQLRLARKFGLPVSIHCRKAWGRLLEILKDEGGLMHGGILHSYSGSAELIPELEKAGLYISFSGVITRHGNRRGKEALRVVSRDRLLLETDSPDLLPRGIESEFNEPANISLVARAVAGCLGVSVEHIAEITWHNAQRCLGMRSC